MNLKNSVYNTLYHAKEKDEWGEKKEIICHGYLLYRCDDGSGFIRKINIETREILSEIKIPNFNDTELEYAKIIRELCVSDEVADFCLMVGGQIDIMNDGWNDMEIVIIK